MRKNRNEKRKTVKEYLCMKDEEEESGSQSRKWINNVQRRNDGGDWSGNGRANKLDWRDGLQRGEGFAERY